MQQQLNLEREEIVFKEQEVLFGKQIESRIGYCFLKRTIDIICSLIGLIILSPLFLIVSILIKIESKGPVFFCQERVGKNGKNFKMYKFRSMVANAEELKEKLARKMK